MKWPTLAPQKKLYCFCGLMLVVVVILIIDHVELRQETARLKRQIVLATRMAADTPVLSDDIERNVNSLDSEIDAVKYRLDDLEAKVRRLSDLESRISSLESVTDDLADKLNTEIQSFRLIIENHRMNIQKILDEAGIRGIGVVF